MYLFTPEINSLFHFFSQDHRRLFFEWTYAETIDIWILFLVFPTFDEYSHIQNLQLSTMFIIKYLLIKISFLNSDLFNENSKYLYRSELLISDVKGHLRDKRCWYILRKINFLISDFF